MINLALIILQYLYLIVVGNNVQQKPLNALQNILLKHDEDFENRLNKCKSMYKLINHSFNKTQQLKNFFFLIYLIKKICIKCNA